MNPSDFFKNLEKIKNLEITWHQITDCPTTPKFHYYVCEINFQNISSIGTGESFLPHFAKLKSTAEALERWAIQNPNLKWINLTSKSISHIKSDSSNGVAFHLNEASAIESAIGELIERDAVLNAYHKKTNPYRLQPSFKWNSINLLNKWKYKLDDVYFLLFPTNFNEYVISCIIEKDTFPYRIFGYGHSKSFDKAIEKSWSEAWRFFWNLLNNSAPESKSVTQIDSPLDHLFFHASEKICINDIFHIQKKILATPTNNSLTPDFSWAAILSDYGLPGSVVKVQSANIQNLYFGQNKDQKCNIHPIG